MTTINYTKALTALPQSGTGCGPITPVKAVITVTTVVGLPDLGVFVYKANASNVLKFNRVANAKDIYDISYNVVDETGYVRKPLFEVVFESVSAATEGIDNSIIPDMQKLCTEYTALQQLSAPVSGSVTG